MTDWLLETLIAVTLLMLLVLAVRRPVARMFGAGWAYALWLVPAARLILPPLPQLFPDTTLSPVIIFIPTAAEATASLPAEAGPGQWVPFLLASWAGGAVIFLIHQWLAYRGFLKRLGAHSRPARPPSYGGISILISRMVDGPLALGLLERRIVIPSDFSRRYTPGERRLAMEHELTHHRRGDIWWNVAAMLVLALNWFNPVAWIAFRAFRADQELACDAAVAAVATPDERHDYARALVKSASTPGLIAACPLHHADQLKRRLRMMRGHRTSRARTAGGFAAVAAFALTGFSLGAREQASDAPVVYVAAPGPVPVARPAPAAFAAAAAPARNVTPAVRADAASRPKPRSRAPIVRRPVAKARPAQASMAEVREPGAALEQRLPQLAMLDLPRPAPTPNVAAIPMPRIGGLRHGASPKLVRVSRTQVVIIGQRLTPEQRVLVNEAIREARDRSQHAHRAARFAQLELALAQHLGRPQVKIDPID